MRLLLAPFTLLAWDGLEDGAGRGTSPGTAAVSRVGQEAKCGPSLRMQLLRMGPSINIESILLDFRTFRSTHLKGCEIKTWLAYQDLSASTMVSYLGMLRKIT